MISRADIHNARPVALPHTAGSPASSASSAPSPAEPLDSVASSAITLPSAPTPPPPDATPIQSPKLRPLLAALPPGSPEQLMAQVTEQLAPLLHEVIPEKLRVEVSGIMAGAAQQLGQPAPPVSDEAAEQFLSAFMVGELVSKGQEKLATAGPEEKARLVETGSALLPILQKAGRSGAAELVRNPPPELQAFLDTYLAIGVPTPEHINATRPQDGRTPGEAVRQATGATAEQGQAISFHIDGADCYSEMERTIASAKKSILFETYTWHDDATGQRMVDLLAARKREGVDVRVIYDAIGQNSYPPDRPKKMLTQLQAAGIEAVEYNRSLMGPTGVNLSHRKLLIADGRVAMTGGMNIGDNYREHWHDTMARVEGSAARSMAREFAFDWKMAGGSTPLPSADTSSEPVLSGSADVSVLVTSPREPGRERQSLAGLLAAIDAARSQVWVENPYFSDARLVAHLEAAQRRGVQVNMILPRGNDMPVFTQLNAISASRLVDAGAKAWLIDTGEGNINFNHTKIAVIDDEWVMLGSANADARSYDENQELVLAVTDRDLARDIRDRLIEPDLARSVPFEAPPLPADTRLLQLAGTFL